MRAVFDAVTEACSCLLSEIDERDVLLERVRVTPPKRPDHGDLATNAPMILARSLGITPRALGEKLCQELERCDLVSAATVAGSGFVNIRLHAFVWHDVLRDILSRGVDYGHQTWGEQRPINLEYVSVNPTGPLHAGHGRGAIIADILGTLLGAVGFKVTREYYINDAGGQIDILARSAYLRYREVLGGKVPDIPEGYYPGLYLKDVAQQIVAIEGEVWLDTEEEAWLPVFKARSVEILMREIRAELGDLGIHHDVFVSEKKIIDAGKIEKALEVLKQKDLVYEGVLPPPQGNEDEEWEPVPLLLFRSTHFGDERDRPLKKASGEWTYFASDIAYHLDKVDRGFLHMINMWGADHMSHIKRLQSVLSAFETPGLQLDIIACQMVHFYDQGRPVKISKRAGTFVTLRDVVEQVGKDVMRFMMVTRDPNSHYDFDFQAAQEQSKNNPVFYIQYAHARAASVLRAAEDMFGAEAVTPQSLTQAPLERLGEEELGLVKLLADWPRQVKEAAQALEPHRLATFMYRFAEGFHTLWSLGNKDTTLRFLVVEDATLSLARMALVRALAFTLASGLRIFGVDPLDEM